MKSNVYLAFGQLHVIPVMKIGKANDVKRREKQIRIEIELFLKCMCERDVFVFEDQLRKRACSLGALHHKGYDWFQYDEKVYEALKGMLAEFGGIENFLNLEQEVARYQLRYY